MCDMAELRARRTRAGEIGNGGRICEAYGLESRREYRIGRDVGGREAETYRTSKSTDERQAPAPELQIALVAAHSVPRLVGRWLTLFSARRFRTARTSLRSSRTLSCFGKVLAPRRHREISKLTVPVRF